MGQPDQAIKAYQDAIAVQPDFAAAHFNLGNAQFDCGQTAAALQSYLLATRYKPAFASAWVALGNVQGDLSRNDDAVISYQKAIALDSEQRPGASKPGFDTAATGSIERRAIQFCDSGIG
jgi:tetratricopeptide (TPR) repeat protein